MKIPASSTLRYKMLRFIYLHGPMSTTDISRRMEKVGFKQIANGLWHCADQGLVTKKGREYQLTEAARNFFDGCAPVMIDEPYMGQVAEPRTFTVNRKLKSLPWAQHMDRLRDISFIGLAGSGA